MNTKFPPIKRNYPRFCSLIHFVLCVLMAGWTNLVGVATSQAQQSSFTNVVDSTDSPPGRGRFAGGFSPPSISGNTVAFGGVVVGTDGIYTSIVGATEVSRIADNTTPAPEGGTLSNNFQNPTVSGTNVAFSAETSRGVVGIYTGTVGVTGASLIADTSTIAPGHGTFTDFNEAETGISGSNVAFFGQYSGGSGIYTGTVGLTGASLIADTSTTAPGHGLFTGFSATNTPHLTAISGDNVAFFGQYSGGEGIYTGTFGKTGASLIADTSTAAPGHGTFTGFGESLGNVQFSISGSKVAFMGQYNGGLGIYTGTVGVTGASLITDTSINAPGHGLFTSFSVPSISGNNIAFIGYYTGGSSIFVDAGGNLIDVIDSGSTLFGSTVSSFELGSSSCDNNQIAFQYALTDGVSGIAIANVVPEPATWVGILLAVTALLYKRRVLAR